MIGLIARNIYSFVFIAYLSILNGFPSNKADSLILLADKQKDNNSKVEISKHAFWKYAESNQDSALFYIKKMLDFTPKTSIKYETWEYLRKGLILFNKNKNLPAETEFLKAVELAKSFNDKESIAYSTRFIGRINAWKTEYSRSIDYHKKAQKLFIELKNTRFATMSNNQIGMQFEALGKFDSALVYYSNNIKNRNTIDYKYSVLFSYKKSAGVYAILNNYKQAYTYLLDGFDYAEKIGVNVSLAELYLTAGELFLNDYSKEDISFEYFSEAKNLFTKIKNKSYIRYIDLCIGDVYFAKGNDSLALQYYYRIINNTPKDAYSTLASAYHKIGMVHKSKNRQDSALVYFQKSISLMCNECPQIGIHNTLIEAADSYIKTGNFNQSYAFLTKAKDIALKSHAIIELVISDEALAKYYKTINNSDSALYFYNMAFNRVKESGLPKETKRIAESLSALYYSRADYKKSSDYLRIANQVNDSLVNINKNLETARLEMRFETKKKEEERKHDAMVSQNEINRQKFIKNYFVAGVLLLVIIALLLFKAYKNKKKDNQLLAKQKNEIQEMAQQLHNADKNKLIFFTNISHEIRTPLALIKSPLERLLKSTDNEKETRKQLQLALNNTHKLHNIVNQILDLRKLDENQLNLNITDFDLIGFCKGIASSFEGYCHQSGCMLVFSSNVAAAQVKLDNIKLHSMLSNLLSNAFKFNKEGGQVWFDVCITPVQLMLTVKDTGKGIAGEHLKNIGTRYYQAETSPIFNEGSGIGLAYVKELVSLLNGKLEISSEVNIGTTISIILTSNDIIITDTTPYTFEIKPHDIVFDRIEELLAHEPDSQLSNSILIVEDNTELRSFLQEIFRHTYHVICAKDGEEGEEMAIRYNPDLIISDIMMPGIQGNELCKMLKNDIRTSHIPVILLTAKDARDSQVDGYKCGADDYIVKPFDTELLTRKVKNIILTRENSRKQFSFSDIESRTNPVCSELDMEFLRKCTKLIHENLDKSDFTVEILSDHIGLNRKTLLRKFKALTGKSPADLIKHTKMSQAAILIREKKLRINEVAFLVGYDDPDRFSSAFKQFHGVAPSAYS